MPDKTRFLALFISTCVGVTLLFCMPVAVAADIYRYVDSDGVIHFTNVPTHCAWLSYLYTGGNRVIRS